MKAPCYVGENVELETFGMINSIDLTVAGVHFSISSGCEIIGSCPSPAYDDFISDAPQFADINVPVTLLAGAKEGLSTLKHCFDSGDMWSLYRDGDSRYIVHAGFGIDSPMWAAELPLDASSIQIHCGAPLLGGERLQGGGERLQGEAGLQGYKVSRLQGGAGLQGDKVATSPNNLVTLKPCHLVTTIASPMRYPLDQILMTYVLARCQGVLLHSAGVLCNGKLWLLAGKSRAGKSTSSALLKGRDGIDLLSDDRIVVRQTEHGLVGYGTPWPGEAKIAANRQAPLAGILFLDQSPLNQIDEIGAADAFERLMPVASIPWYEPELFPDVMDFCGVVAESLPMYRMQFRPDSEAADMIAGFMRAN